MKKKILFVMPHLKPCGVTTAFLNLINEIKADRGLELDLFVFDTDEVEILPKEINVLPVGKLTRLLAVDQKTADKAGTLLGLVRLLFSGIAKFFANHYAYSLAFLFEKTIGEYDVAISFSQSGKPHELCGGMNEFVLTKVEAEKKVTVLHCDYAKSGLDTLYNCDLYQLFDKVASPSEGVIKSLLSRVPECSENAVLLHNCHNFSNMEALSKIDTQEYDRSVLNILTVDTIREEKGHFRALDALIKLKEDGLKFCWHVVGDGKDMEKLKEKVSKYNLSRNVIFYGEQENPYKFYVNADVVLVPSYFEGASTAFARSEYFNIPVVATRTTSTDELVMEKNLGLVCENSESGIYSAFEYIAKNPHIIREIKRFNREVPDNNLALHESYELLQQ